jgi:predicted RNA binding protein YcfA (HicA-like mRNA interferase family)
MSKLEKLLEKLKNGSIDSDELRTLLVKMGWILDRTKGSHEQWLSPSKQRMTLATHGRSLLRYQIEEARKKIIGG